MASTLLTSAVLTSTVLVAVDGRSRFGGAGPTELAESSWPNRAGCGVGFRASPIGELAMSVLFEGCVDEC